MHDARRAPFARELRSAPGVKAFVLAQRLYLFIPPVPVVFS